MICKKRILAEISKTPEGQARIVQKSERLDRTVAEMGEMHRADQPRGGNEEMVLNQTPPAFETPIEFIPMDHEPLSLSGDGRKFHVGIYVGVGRRTGQQMIHRGNGIEYARTVLRFPESNKWDKEELAQFRATPWSLHVPKETEVAFKDAKEVEKMDSQGKLVIARQPYLKAADFIKYGLTKGCP